MSTFLELGAFLDDVGASDARLHRPWPVGSDAGHTELRTVVAISGSPSPASRTAHLADHVLCQLASDDIAVEHVRLSALNPEALLTGRYDDPGIRPLAEKINSAHGVVVATPIFKASYSGLLKAALDVLPQFAMAGKVILPLATGGSVAHALALDYALRPVLQSMGARHIVQSCLVTDTDMSAHGGAFGLSTAAEGMLAAALANFRHSLAARDDARRLGHPRPQEG